MAVSVIANLMSGGLNGARDPGGTATVLADEKKLCLGIAPSQHVKQMHGVRIIGAIVKGQRHLIGVAAMREGTAVELRRGRHGGVSGVAGGSSGDESEVRPKHG